MIKTQKEIKLKDGSTLAKGLPVTFQKDLPSRCLIQMKNRLEPFRVRVTSAFKEPSVTTLQKWDNEGFCKSIGGKKVEPDGWDCDSTPSWLLALSLI